MSPYVPFTAVVALKKEGTAWHADLLLTEGEQVFTRTTRGRTRALCIAEALGTLLGLEKVGKYCVGVQVRMTADFHRRRAEVYRAPELEALLLKGLTGRAAERTDELVSLLRRDPAVPPPEPEGPPAGDSRFPPLRAPPAGSPETTRAAVRLAAEAAVSGARRFFAALAPGAKVHLTVRDRDGSLGRVELTGEVVSVHPEGVVLRTEKTTWEFAYAEVEAYSTPSQRY